MRDYEGRVYDGPIVGARVYFDVNRNGELDIGTDIYIGETDRNGRYSGSEDSAHADKPILALLDGAHDTDAPDAPLNGLWRAPAGSKNISPLTEVLVTAKISQEDLRNLAGIPASVDLTTYDPFEDETFDATDEAVIAAGQKLAAELKKKPDDIEAAVAKAFAPDPEPEDQKPTAISYTTYFNEVKGVGRLAYLHDGRGVDAGAWRTIWGEDVSLPAVLLADIKLTDDTLGDNQLSLSDETYFELRETDDRLVWQLWRTDKVRLDYELATRHETTLQVSSNRALDKTLILNVVDFDDPPTALTLTPASLEVEEGTQKAVKLTDVGFVDVDGQPKNRPYAVAVAPNDIFEIENRTELWLKEGAELDFETAQSHEVKIFFGRTGREALSSIISGEGGSDAGRAATTFTLTVTDVDETLPPALNLLGQQSVREDSRIPAKGRAVFSGGDVSQGIRFFISASNVEMQINSDGTQIEGSFGRLEVNRDGSWAYFLGNGNETVDELQSGQRLTDSFNVFFRNNANELLISQKLTITILGGNDIYILQEEEDGRDLEYGFRAFREYRDIIVHNDKDVGLQDGNYFHLDVGHGDDVVHGGPAREWISGEDGNDELYGGGGDDGMRGGDGNDILFGDAGDDDMHGGDGDDELYGGAGDDELSGGIGNDILDGGAHGAEGDVIQLGYSVNSNLSLTLDATDISLWQRGYDGIWSQGTDSSFIYRRFWLDLDNDGEGGEVDAEGQEIRDSDDQYHYFTNIERIELFGGDANDIFILNVSADEKVFVDGFTRRAQIDGEKDKVGIRLPSVEISVIENAEDSLKALKEMLGIDWKQDTGTSRYTYDDSTTIYRTADDMELMELGDFAETMTIEMFELLPLEPEVA